MQHVFATSTLMSTVTINQTVCYIYVTKIFIKIAQLLKDSRIVQLFWQLIDKYN